MNEKERSAKMVMTTGMIRPMLFFVLSLNSLTKFGDSVDAVRTECRTDRGLHE